MRPEGLEACLGNEFLHLMAVPVHAGTAFFLPPICGVTGCNLEFFALPPSPVATGKQGIVAMHRSQDSAAAGGDGENARADLTALDAIRLDYLAPPADLGPFVTTYFLFRCNDRYIRDIQPAAVGQFQIYLCGQGMMGYPHGRADPSFPETLQGPTTAAAPFEVNGPFHAFGAALSALGWAAFTGIEGKEAADRLFDARSVFGQPVRDLGDEVRAIYDRDPETDGAAMVEKVSAFIRHRLKRVPAEHVELLKQVADWLGTGFNPPVQALYDVSRYSPRQVQRLVLRYFGSSLSHLVRAYRATRVVALLSEPGVTDERVALLTNEFYDQSHMIREIREFVGRTPHRLAAEEETILRVLVDVRNFREIKPNVAPLPKLETGGDEA